MDQLITVVKSPQLKDGCDIADDAAAALITEE